MISDAPSTQAALPVFVRKFYAAAKQPSDRCVLVAFFVATFWLAYLLPLFTGGGDAPSGVRTADVIGFVAVAVVLQRLGSDRVLSVFDLEALAVAVIVLIHPWHYIGALALTAIGSMFVGRKDKRLASLGQLCIGLAWIDLWGKVVLTIIEPWLLPIETALGYLPLWLFDSSFSLVGNAILGTKGHSVIVFTACSAFNNTVTTAFIWLSLLKIRGAAFQGWHYAAMALSIAIIVLLNTARLALMAYSRAGYEFWHNSYGATIMSLAMLSTTLGLFYLAIRREERPA